MSESWPVVPQPKEEERSIWRSKSWVHGGVAAAVPHQPDPEGDEPEGEWPEVPQPAINERKFWSSASWRKPSDGEVSAAWGDLAQSIKTLQDAGHEVPAGLVLVVQKKEVLACEEEEMRATYLGFKEHMLNPEGVPAELVSAATSFIKGYDVLKCVYMTLNIKVAEEDSESDESLGVDELEEMAEILEG